MKGSIRQRGSTWTWQHLTGTVGGKRQYATGTQRTKKLAQTALTASLDKFNKGTLTAPSKLTVEQWLTKWLTTIDVKPATLHAYGDIVRCRLTPHLGQIRLTELRGSDIKAVYKALGTNGRKDGGPLSPGSVEATHRCLHRALQQAVEDGVLQVNPADIPSRKRAPAVTAVLNPWTPDELNRFKASVAGDRLYPLWATAIATGCRRGELAGLRWDDVDLDGGRITVINTRTSTNYKVYEGSTKTGIGRPVGIDAETVDVLRQWHADQAQERMLAGEARVTNDYVFTEPDGNVTHPESITNRWDAAVKRSGLRRQRFHDARHAHASVLAHNGVDMVTISKRLGHSTPTLTMNLYVHANEESDRRAVAAFSEAMGQ